MHLVALCGGNDRRQRRQADLESAREQPRRSLVAGGDLVRVALGLHEIVIDDGGSVRRDVPKDEVSALVKEGKQESVEATATSRQADHRSTVTEECDGTVELAPTELRA